MSEYKNMDELNSVFDITKKQSDELFGYLNKLRNVDRNIQLNGCKKEISNTDYEHIFYQIVYMSNGDYLMAEEWLKNVAILGEFDDIYCFLYQDRGKKYKDIIEMYGFKPAIYMKN